MVSPSRLFVATHSTLTAGKPSRSVNCGLPLLRKVKNTLPYALGCVVVNVLLQQLSFRTLCWG